MPVRRARATPMVGHSFGAPVGDVRERYDGAGTYRRENRSAKMVSTIEIQETLRRQLAAFAQFTSRSLGESDLDSLMSEGCLRSRAGLGVSHAKLLEYMPDTDCMLLRAGVGWKPGVVGQYRVAPTLESPIGYAFAFSEPVGISDYTRETKFQYPDLLKEHRCVSSLNVPVRTDAGAFGVLEVDHTSARVFSNDDIYFLSGLGNTIAKAIELHRAMKTLEAALDAKQLLVREMNHRIKNNLSLVAAILSLHGRRAGEPALREELASAVARINNLALVHDRLQLFSSSVTRIDAADHFRDLCEMLRSLLPTGIVLNPECSGWIAGDNVESLTLIANELVTNAAKYAFAGRNQGQIILGYREEGAGWRLWVADDGVGMPLQHSNGSSVGFGSQLVDALVTRVNAQLVYSAAGTGGTRAEVFSGVTKN
jgi:two-component sensor histidine kinase